MPYTLTIHTEVAPCTINTDAGQPGGRYWGVTLFARLTGGDAALDPETAKALLCPWLWEATTWRRKGDPSGSEITAINNRPNCDEAIRDSLGSVLANIVATDTKRLDLPLMENENEDGDDEDEYDPQWPVVLLQLSRVAPEISHGLNLAHLFEYEEGKGHPELVSIKPITPIDPAIVKIVYTNDDDVPGYDELKQSGGPIDGVRRLVSTGTRKADGTFEPWETERNWVSELPARLGQALDPLARLADMRAVLELNMTNLDKALDSLLQPLTDPSVLLPLCLSKPVDGEADYKFVEAWAKELGSVRPELHADLRKHIAGEGTATTPLPSAEELRERLSDPAYFELFRTALSDAQDKVVSAGMASAAWQPDMDRLQAWVHQVLPEAIARQEHGLLEKLSAKIAEPGDDLNAARKYFPELFPKHAACLLGIDHALPRLKVLAEQQMSGMFVAAAGVDKVAETGLVHLADALFGKETTRDLHAMLDGYCLAVRETTPGRAGKFILANRAKVSIRADKLAFATPMVVPQQVSFEMHDTASTEIRNAIVQYHGLPLIPASNTENPVDQEEENPPVPAVAFDFEPAGEGSLPQIAYGRTFETVCGYQALGGALPAGFCAADMPFAFEPVTLATFADGNPDFVKRHAPFRSLPPGAPRLSAARNPDLSIPATFVRPGDEDVRPLWREYRSNSSDRVALALSSEAPTVFLDHLNTERTSLEFQVAPPALAAGQDTGPGNTEKVYQQGARVWQYWTRRDQDFGQTRTDLPPATEVDDPAVVGAPAGQTGGNGGIVVRLHHFLRNGSMAQLAEHHVPLADGDRLQVRSLVSADVATAAFPAPAGAEAVITLPVGQMFLLEIRTVVDSAYFAGGSDHRFENLGTPGPYGREFGAAVIALECLPAAKHMPDAASIWQAMRIEDKDGLTSAILESADERFDCVGRVTATRQLWRWDGGPIAEDLPHLDWTKAESGTTRDGAFLEFERALFADHGWGGQEDAPVLHSIGTPDKLLALPLRTDRGADYIRVRCHLVSRYAALRRHLPGQADLLLATSQSGGRSTAWKGCGLRWRRTRPLPTPRLAIAVPTFAPLDPASAAGGMALFLDHPMFDTQWGGGLAERIVAEVLVQQVPRDLGDTASEQDAATAALMVGRDPVFHEDGNPFVEGAAGRISFRRDGNWAGHDSELWSPDNPEAKGLRARLRSTAVIGQTLEPSSAAPVIPFAIALFDPGFGEDPSSKKFALQPGTMASVRVRVELDSDLAEPAPPGSGEKTDYASPWSAPMWIHFQANTANYSQWSAVPDGATAIRLGPGDTSDASFASLAERINDAPPDSDHPYLVRGLVAVVGKIVSDIDDREQLLPLAVAEVSLSDDKAGLVTAFPEVRPDNWFVRLVEIERVAEPSGGRSLPASADRWFPEFGEKAQDVSERIVAIGPFFRAPGRPPT